MLDAVKKSDSYWARMARVFLPVGEEAEPEEGEAMKGLPPFLLLFVSPIVGLLFLIFLPFVGFGSLAYMVYQIATGKRPMAPAPAPEAPETEK